MSETENYTKDTSVTRLSHLTVAEARSAIAMQVIDARRFGREAKTADERDYWQKRERDSASALAELGLLA